MTSSWQTTSSDAASRLMSSGQRKHRNCCLLIIFVAMLFSLLTLRPCFLGSQSDMEWFGSFSNEKCWSTGHSGNWVLRLYTAFLLLIRRKVSDSPLWGAIRGTQRGFMGWQEQPWPLLPSFQLQELLPQMALCLPEVGKEGKLWRATKSETVQHKDINQQSYLSIL